MRGHPNLNPNWRDFQEPPERLARATNERTPYLEDSRNVQYCHSQSLGQRTLASLRAITTTAPRRIGHNALSSCRDSRTPPYACFLSLVSALIE